MHLVIEDYLISGQHKIYYAAFGNPKGQAFLFVHGGPGGGTNLSVLNFFDLKNSYVILVDQRGCGKSLPLGSIVENSTQHLIDDFENIRKMLKIKSWILFGGSWGSTLSLFYAQNYPQIITGMILRGIFLGGETGIKWLTNNSGASRIFPEAWAELNRSIPELKNVDNPVTYMYEQICAGKDEIAIAFAKWEGRISCHIENPELIKAMGSYPVGYTVGKLELHYMFHDFFITENELLENCNKLSMPIDIVHGRYDIVCPIDHALNLAVAIPHAKLHILPNSGHSAHEPEISKKLIYLAKKYSKLNI